MEQIEENDTVIPEKESNEHKVSIGFEAVNINNDSHENIDNMLLELDQVDVNTFDKEKEKNTDYSQFSREKIVAHFNKLFESSTINDIKENVEELKAVFYKLHRVFVDEQRELFLSNGGQIEAFKPEDSVEVEFKALYKKYKDQKTVLNEQLEKQKQENLTKRYEIINKLKDLIKNHIEKSVLGPSEKINVLKLNINLDEMK